MMTVTPSSRSDKLSLKRERVRCALCGEDDAVVRFTSRGSQLTAIWAEGIRYNVDTPQTIVACKTCGLTYVNPRIVLGPGYTAYSVEQQQLYFANSREIRLWAYRNLLRQVPSWLGRDAQNLLDVGCGDGVLFEAARKIGIEAMGTEIDQNIARQVRERLGQDAVVTLNLDELPRDEFDVVALINVLEHVTDPMDVLQACARRLQPDGILLTHVPNFGGLPARLRGAKWHQIEPLEHLYYFTAHTLGAMMRKAGLTPLDRFNLIVSRGLRGSLQRYLGRIGVYMDNGLGLVARRLPTGG